MSVSDIISKSLIEYDSTTPTIQYLIENTYFEGYKTNSDTERSRLKFIHKDTNKVLFETEIETLAIFYDKLNIWSWSWSQVGLYNSENYLAKEMLLYALKLGYDMSYIKSIITTSRGVIRDPIQVDINLAIGSGIIKQPYIYPYIYEVEKRKLYYYIILLNKQELDKLSKKLNKQSNEQSNEQSD
ncbi:hypothetical protein QJ850_gp636 [Acanthamoeba polyphaga mimivirus]|uniref:Uncharacterized protein n=1 Tax=Acanthamoeba polyphaga mimivirus Kroon TaxID=3069720 RepID=A0A0G2Y2T7_9VIRU|nr:hypothetical protein QJ850_gp636 [Acanthamoeba polyphaga mimivirus]AKI80063.1 hypothetical protein [Acanthamoeba polyphaga mimivirus Kroon]